MAASLLVKNPNFRLLFGAGTLTNLGDGLVILALPWLATLMTQNPIAIAAVAAAGRLPWLFFAIPAGVIVDNADHRAHRSVTGSDRSGDSDVGNE
jgi:hypothetical protein